MQRSKGGSLKCQWEGMSQRGKSLPSWADVEPVTDVFLHVGIPKVREKPHDQYIHL